MEHLFPGLILLGVGQAARRMPQPWRFVLIGVALPLFLLTWALIGPGDGAGYRIGLGAIAVVLAALATQQMLRAAPAKPGRP